RLPPPQGRRPSAARPAPRHNPLDDAQHVAVVQEGAVDALQQAGALHVDLLRPVDHDLADRRVVEQRLEWTQAADLVDDLADQLLAQPLGNGYLDAGELLFHAGARRRLDGSAGGALVVVLLEVRQDGAVEAAAEGRPLAGREQPRRLLAPPVPVRVAFEDLIQRGPGRAPAGQFGKDASLHALLRVRSAARAAGTSAGGRRGRDRRARPARGGG